MNSRKRAGLLTIVDRRSHLELSARLLAPWKPSPPQRPQAAFEDLHEVRIQSTHQHFHARPECSIKATSKCSIRDESASECNHSVGNLFRALEPNALCGQSSSSDHVRAMCSNMVPWPMHFGQWPHSITNHIISKTIKDLENRQWKQYWMHMCNH